MMNACMVSPHLDFYATEFMAKTGPCRNGDM